MNIYKFLLWLFLIFDLFIINNTYIQLYNTEDALAIQSYDCIYYTNVTARNNETTPYCIRTKENVPLNRSSTTNSCENSGEEWSFRSLKEMNISEDEVLKWNSSIEMADRYAAYLLAGDEQFADDKICNCPSNTFGKFCEYEFMTMDTFEQTIQYQFDLKLKYRNGSQLWGNITCYTTLTNCYFGLRCLAWQNICDGKQQCMDGIDEDHCEELEFNECEENEYRCKDGSCIPEQYWLDGQYDCSDKSDEQNLDEYFVRSSLCPLTSAQFICDETTAHNKYFACGDGQFCLEYMQLVLLQCYNYRNLMFFCEHPSDNINGLWTLENGHCADEGRIEKSLTDMDELEKCLFYLKCKLTTSRIVGCDDVIRHFHPICDNKTITYPSKPVLKPYVQTVYQLPNLCFLLMPSKIFWKGSIKCVGYQARSGSQEILFDYIPFFMRHPFDYLFCTNATKKLVSGPQMDKNCWNDTKQSFLCQKSQQCISKHRLRNHEHECIQDEDEGKDDSQSHYMKNKYRFTCSGESSLHLFVSKMGDGSNDCDTGNDEFITKLKWKLIDYKCTTPNSIECNVLKTYIQSPSSALTSDNSKFILFRQYCDTVWHFPQGFDESLCNEWKCPKDQYQCLSGHCTPIRGVTEEFNFDWDCPDASDNIGLLGIIQLSEHNAKIISDSDLQNIKDSIVELYIRYNNEPLSTFCNITQEYGCFLANVLHPLNFTINRPCINLTQIGDGIIDCYGGLDERNLLTCGNNTDEQRGFDFHCSNEECIPFHRLCEKRCSNSADNLLCDQVPILLDPDASYHHTTSIAKFSCDGGTTEIMKYYCDLERLYLGAKNSSYRIGAWSRKKAWIYLPEYPILKDIIPYDYEQSSQRETINIYSQIPHKQANDGKEGWICGRGVAIKRNKTNEIQCFCPPSLYGQYCQYFSDRITIITSLNNIPSELLEQQNNTIKILALFLLNDTIIDHHVFHLPLVLSGELDKKFRFNFIHRRPKLLTNSCTIRFEAYHLSFDSSIKFLAVWEYPIQFLFLPSYRLVQILKFEKIQTSMNETHTCQISNPCLHNSTCHSIMNKINNMSTYYCHCNNQTFGKDCQHILQPIISPTCSKHALLRPLSSLKSICLCSIHSYGPTCHLNHTCVNKNPCGIDRGKCYINPDNITYDYICVCDKKFFGDRCEFDSAMVRINFTDFSFVQTPSNFILSSIIQLCDLHPDTLDLIIHQKRVYQGLPPSITEIYHNDHRLPKIGIMKLYHKQDLSNDYVANLKEPNYFILYSVSSNISRMNFTSMINVTNYCPYTPTIFHKNVSTISSLSQFLILNESNINKDFNMSKMVFKYHSLCNASYSLMCFHDDNYICLCDDDDRAECFRYNSKLDECNGRCLIGGQCIHGDLGDRRDFVCLCPRCYHGSVCQHNTELLSFTLETLFTNDLYAPSVAFQRLFFSLFIIIPSILFLLGALNNICCYATFNRKKPLIVGTGHYLRTASIINQLTLLILLLKLIHLVLSIKGHIVHHLTNTILCKILSYLLSCSCRMSYWLMGMVAIERVYVTWFLTGTWLKSPKIAKCIIAAVIIGIAACDVHELIYYESIEDPKASDINNITLCITSYPSGIATYNQVNIILNYIMPFLINLLSTIILIILITQRRVAVTAKKEDSSAAKRNARGALYVYIDLWIKNKELILAPSATMVPQLFSIPQFILSFSLACQEFKVSWQRYLLIISYFIIYLPHVLSYKLYVSPSSFFTEEFHATKLNQRILELRAFITRK